MSKRSTRVWSVLMVIIMIFNMIPVYALAEETTDSVPDEETEQQYVSTEDVHVVEEIVDRRTEYTKVFQLSNGLHLASMYATPVHYEVDGQWAEIDNTLQQTNTRSGNTYTNTAGVWQVSFPQSMTKENGVTITKDGYVFNFRMTGEILDPNVTAEIESVEIEEIKAQQSIPKRLLRHSALV